MTKSRLPLPLCTLVSLVACNQVSSALSMGEQAAADTKGAAPTDSKDATPPTDKPAAVAAVPTGPASLDDMLGLVHDGAETYVVFKTPDSLLGVAEGTATSFEQPVKALVSATSPDKLAEVTQNFATFQTTITEARAALTAAGTDLARGVVLSSVKPGDDEPVITFNASSPEAAKNLFTALKIPDAATIVCAATPAHAGYVTCAKDQATIDAYKPGDGRAARDRVAAALPGIGLDELAVVGHVDNDVHFALGQPSAGFTVHFSAPADAKDLSAVMAAGKGDLLRFAPPGTGFMWMQLERDELNRRGLDQVPPPFNATAGAFTGEILLGGSADPAALQARLGFSDTSSLAPLADLAVALVGPAINNKPIPDIPGSKVLFKSEEVALGAEKTKALHLGVSGMPQAKAIADQLGLSLDAWVYPAEGTLAAIVGVDSKGIGNVKAAASSDATLAALPESLAASLRAGEVGFISHIPLDGLQSPALGPLLDNALAKVPGYNPAAARTGLGIVAPLSTMTMWITEHQNSAVIHFALQTIGHSGDEEGKAALAAVTATDPARAFADLALKYPSSPRLASYQARAGQGGTGALIGASGPSLMLAAAAGAVFLRGMSEISSPPVVVPPVVEATPPVETPKTETPKPKTETPKPKTETPKTETPKTETPKTETPKTETPTRETPKTETPKTETPKLPPLGAKRVGREEKK